MRMRPRLWMALHAFVVLLPVLGVVARAPDVQLFGVEIAGPPAEWSVAAWVNERFQPALQAAFESRVGLRGVMVRTDNSAQALLLGSEPATSAFVIGENGTVFYRDDLAHAARRPPEVAKVVARMEELTTHLGSIHRKLVARGKELVVVIAPGKGAIYPDDIPARWRRPGATADQVIHDALREQLERNGVLFGDGHAMLAGKHGEERELLFPHTARH